MQANNIAAELETFKTAQLAFAKATQEYNKTVQEMTAKINKIKAPAAKRVKTKRTLPPTPVAADGSWIDNGYIIGGERFRVWG